MRVITGCCLLIFLCAGCTPSPIPDGIGTAVYVDGDTIAPYRPKTALTTAVSPVDRAAFTAIDIHCHWSLEEDADDLIAAMDERNVHAAINLSGGWGEKLDGMLARFYEPYPQRLLVFCNIDFSRIDEPNFGQTMADYLADARSRGVAGLKIFKNLGLTIKDASGAIVAVDDARLDPIWNACGELGMPVLIHSADPVAFFQPIDGDNERWMQLRRHPNWAFPADQFPPRDEVIEQRSRIMRRHANTMFIGAHVGGNAENLSAAAAMLDAHPNLVFDISGRVGELGRQPYAARKFLLQYQDRILFGTDRFPGRSDQPRYRVYYRFLESNDEYFDYYDHHFPPSGDWKIYGVFLPDDVLKKVYHDNAARLLFDR